MKPAYCLLFALLLGPRNGSAAEDTRALIERVSGVYRSMGSSLILRTGVRRSMMDQTAKSPIGARTVGPRPNRLIVAGKSIRSDIWGDLPGGEKSCFTRIWTRGRVILAMATPSRKMWSERPAEDPVTAGARETLETQRFSLFERIRDLPEMTFAVTSSGRGEVKVAGRKIACVRVKLKLDPVTAKKHRGPPAVEPKTYFCGPLPRPAASLRMAVHRPWTAELWIEPETGLVWRAHWASYNGDGAPLEERIDYQEVATGTAVPRHELEFTPAPGMSASEDFFDPRLPR